MCDLCASLFLFSFVQGTCSRFKRAKAPLTRNGSNQIDGVKYAFGDLCFETLDLQQPILSVCRWSKVQLYSSCQSPSYGTGAIMVVPGHDMHDHEFALKYDIPIRWVVTPDGGSSGDSERPYSGEGISVNSSSPILGLDINGLPSKEAASKVIEWVEKIGNGNKKLMDWLFARQRYWGEPIPVVFLKDTGEGVPLPESELPLALPELDDFTPSGTGEPPLSKAVSWVETADLSSGKPARRETNTMPQWAGSCWYYLRFMDPKNSEALVDKMKEMKHLSCAGIGALLMCMLAVLNMLFFTYFIPGSGTRISMTLVQYMACRDSDGNFMFADSVDVFGEHHQERIPDEKVMKSGDSFVLKDNPKIRLIARAHKMSKSRGNVVKPDDVVFEYGADSLRLYEMFMGPFSSLFISAPFLHDLSYTGGIEGVHRFLGRVWRLIVGSPLPNGTFRDGTVTIDNEPLLEQLRSLHKCIDKVTEEIEGTRFNTGISAMTEFINAAYKWDKLPRLAIEPFVLLLSPYEELWFRLGHSNSLAYEPFLKINGKTRGTIQVEETCTKDDAFKLASIDQKLSKYLDGRNVRKRIYVPNNGFTLKPSTPLLIQQNTHNPPISGKMFHHGVRIDAASLKLIMYQLVFCSPESSVVLTQRYTKDDGFDPSILKPSISFAACSSKERTQAKDDPSILKPYFLDIRSNATLSVTERIPDLFSVLASKPGIRIWKYSYDMSNIISMGFNFRAVFSSGADLDWGLKNDIRVLKRMVEHVSIHKSPNYQAYPRALSLFYRLCNDAQLKSDQELRDRTSRTKMHRFSVATIGGDTIWGGLDWSPEEGYKCFAKKAKNNETETMGQNGKGCLDNRKHVHYGKMISFGKDVAEAQPTEIERMDFKVMSNTTLSVIERIPDMFSVLTSKHGIRICKYSYDMSKIISMRFNSRIVFRVLKRMVEHVVSIHKPSNYQACPRALRLFYRLCNDAQLKSEMEGFNMEGSNPSSSSVCLCVSTTEPSGEQKTRWFIIFNKATSILGPCHKENGKRSQEKSQSG
ncbi:hypothetical protein ACSBR1_016477 [Camellia fascicularis]